MDYLFLDWFYQLFQTRVYPGGSGTTYGPGSIGDCGASIGRVMTQNSGQRFRFVRSRYDFRLLGVSSYDTTAGGSFNSQGLINFYSGIRTSNGPIFIGGNPTTSAYTKKMTAGYAFEVHDIVDRNGKYLVKTVSSIDIGISTSALEIRNLCL